MEIDYIDNKLGKFEMCGFPGCDADAKHQVETVKYTIGACKKHKDELHTRLQLLKGRDTPLALQRKKLVNIERVFAVIENKKCLYVAWRNGVYRGEEIEVPQAAPKKKSYTFVAEEGEWMTSKCEVLRLKDMKIGEIQAAAYALVKANYARVHADVKWALEFDRQDAAAGLPYTVLAVGTKKAKKKLDEFLEELQSR